MVVLILAVAGYLFYVGFLAGKIEILKPLKVEVEVLQVPSINSDFNDDFLNRLPYTGLVQSAKLPITAGVVGRNNPFSEIPFSLGLK
ncbi:MAG: hypothetical protein PHW95_02955 [Patescibacteria group bacterium]|nr:hypothetical protein [Patescibacteria group bacterium]